MLKKILLVLVITILFSLPSVSQAAEHRLGDRIIVGSEEVVRDNLYIAAGDVVIDGTIEGDLYVAAGVVTINGQINGDLMVLAANLTINGQVGDDLRVAASQVDINGIVGGEVLVGADTFNLFSKAQVDNGIYASLKQLNLSGASGPVKAWVDKLNVDSSAQISGDLDYYSNQEATISSQATIVGQANFNQLESATTKSMFDLSGRLISILTTFFMGLLFVYFLPKLALRGAESWRKRSLINFIWGFLALIVVPILSFILLLTLVGAPLSLGLIFTYIIFIYLGMIVAVIGLGYCLEKYFGKAKKHPNWLTVLIGVLIYYLVGLIPYIGGATIFVLSLIGLGVVVSGFYKLILNKKASQSL